MHDLKSITNRGHINFHYSPKLIIHAFKTIVDAQVPTVAAVVRLCTHPINTRHMVSFVSSADIITFK
jgi:hypothetical protein